MDYSYKRVAETGFEQVRARVEHEAEGHGFRIAHVHDLQATLASKGFPIQPLCIYELLLSGDSADAEQAALLMPCRLHVYIEEDRVWVGAIRPTLIALMFPEADISAVAERVEAGIVGLVEAAAG